MGRRWGEHDIEALGGRGGGVQHQERFGEKHRMLTQPRAGETATHTVHCHSYGTW